MIPNKLSVFNLYTLMKVSDYLHTPKKFNHTLCSNFFLWPSVHLPAILSVKYSDLWARPSKILLSLSQSLLRCWLRGGGQALGLHREAGAQALQEGAGVRVVLRRLRGLACHHRRRRPSGRRCARRGRRRRRAWGPRRSASPASSPSIPGSGGACTGSSP